MQGYSSVRQSPHKGQSRQGQHATPAPVTPTPIAFHPARLFSGDKGVDTEIKGCEKKGLHKERDREGGRAREREEERRREGVSESETGNVSGGGEDGKLRQTDKRQKR